MDRTVGRDVGRLARQRLIGGLDERELVREALPVGELQRGLAALDAQALIGDPPLPEVERLGGADAPHDPVHVPGARAPVRTAAILEEADVVAVGGPFIAVEDVVGRLVGLVDRLLDDPQPHHSDVEIGVARSVRGDARHVVDSF